MYCAATPNTNRFNVTQITEVRFEMTFKSFSNQLFFSEIFILYSTADLMIDTL